VSYGIQISRLILRSFTDVPDRIRHRVLGLRETDRPAAEHGAVEMWVAIFVEPGASGDCF
jgi:hypothetical protein